MTSSPSSIRRHEQEEGQRQRDGGGGGGLLRGGVLTGFLPWIIFWVVSSPSTWEVAAVGALIAAVIVAVPDSRGAGGVKLLDLGSIAFFALISVLAVFLDRRDLSWLEDWAQVISTGVLALIAFASLMFTPFTEQYARDSTPPELWDSPVFKKINRGLTLGWGIAFTLVAISGVIAIKGSHSSRDFFTWILPIILIVGTFKLQGRYIQYVRSRATSAAA